MPDDLESMAWHMLATLGHGGLSLLVLAFAATLALSVATNSWPAVCWAPNLNSPNGRLVNDLCCHNGQGGFPTVNLTSLQTVVGFNGDAPLIPAPTTKLITSAVALLRPSPYYRFHTAFLSPGPVLNGKLPGDLYREGDGDPALVPEDAWLPAHGLRRQHGGNERAKDAA
jgi:D-alanyl-D-alanine carboxypeptidase